jgi:hypothetical protein
MKDRIDAEQGAGVHRGGSPANFSAGASTADRAGFGSEQSPSADQSQDVLSSQIRGNPHSARGFRKALMKTQRSGSALKDMVSARDTSGKGFRKPNYFAQGGRRHGMHIGSGAPATSPAQHEGAAAGGGGR